MAHLFWTEREDELVMKMFLEREKPEVIAQAVKRSPKSVLWRIHMLRDRIKEERSSTGGYILHPKPGVLVHRTMMNWAPKKKNDLD